MWWDWSRWKEEDRVFAKRYPGVSEKRGHVWPRNRESETLAQTKTKHSLYRWIHIKFSKCINGESKGWSFAFDKAALNRKVVTSKPKQ
jgi:hypothetical protein